jgi:NAD(P)-dependent dehydrogenase (short-subunit alcohol dehydrogenase family)
MEVIALGTFLCSTAVARHMIERGQGGRIINIASANGKVGAPLLTAYCAAKFAVMGITQSMAHDLARYHINVNAVCPGPVDTAHLAEAQVARAARLGLPYDELYRRTAASIPWGRHGTPDDVAAAVAFLSSREADFITGHGLNVDGGWLMAR